MVKKVALFIEGKSGLIFVYNLLQKIFDPSFIAIDCLKIETDNNLKKSHYSHVVSSPKIKFLLIEVGGDEKVLSVMVNRAKGMLGQGFQFVWGLRDMFSDVYDKQSSGRIDSALMGKILKKTREALDLVARSPQTHLFFSVMELEAWYLGFYHVLERIGLDIRKINKVLRKDIRAIDPEKEFFKPKRELSTICQRIWGKKYNEVRFSYKISKEIKITDINELAEGGKIFHFRVFFEHLKLLE